MPLGVAAYAVVVGIWDVAIGVFNKRRNGACTTVSTEEEPAPEDLSCKTGVPGYDDPKNISPAARVNALYKDPKDVDD